MKTPEMTFEQACDLFNYEPRKRPLTAEEVAKLLHVSVPTLEGYRLRDDHNGLRFFRPPKSRRVLYAEKDVLAYIAAGEGMSFSTRERA